VSRWFRFHADAMRNPKVARLSDKEFRLWVELLAVASENDGVIPCLDDLKHILKRRLDHLSTGVERLISMGLIDALGDGYEPHGWAKHQYKSDVSTARVQKHRSKGNVSETPPDTETDTEVVIAEAITTERAKRSARKVSVVPHRMPDDWVPGPLPDDVAALVAQWPEGRLQREALNTRDYWRSTKIRRPGWDLTFHNRIRDVHDKVLRETRPNDRPASNDQAPRNPYVRAVIAGQAARAADERRQPGGWTEHGEAAF